jgi:hypothetical protein
MFMLLEKSLGTGTQPEVMARVDGPPRATILCYSSLPVVKPWRDEFCYSLQAVIKEI